MPVLCLASVQSWEAETALSGSMGPSPGGICCSAAEEYDDVVGFFLQFSYGICEEGEILGIKLH